MCFVLVITFFNPPNNRAYGMRRRLAIGLRLGMCDCERHPAIQLTTFSLLRIPPSPPISTKPPLLLLFNFSYCNKNFVDSLFAKAFTATLFDCQFVCQVNREAYQRK
ncbi:hypothetical protein QR680_003537 [Steinernema hermaphroditum]|uniref:Uncharacterized protein n=1 Tax=Steinernema hermaphroditum TaxID=289476 RepID=A0AA39HKQ4_9BILA|nr:hypothetical protein QR680_003537 [Steinernema hermaphroditum]